MAIKKCSKAMVRAPSLIRRPVNPGGKSPRIENTVERNLIAKKLFAIWHIMHVDF